MTHLTHAQYRADIDGLRAIAVLSVVAYHAFPGLVRGGFIGVDIFFVISGYLISTIIFDNLSKERFSFIEFYSRRIKRIFPALIIVLIACFACGWFVLLADEYKQLGEHIAAGSTFISNVVLWKESGYFDSAAETKPLLHLWKEQFYIVWPLLLWWAWKKRLNWLTLIILIGIISFTLNVKGIRKDAIATFYSPQTRFWELVVGSVLAYVTLFKKNFLGSASQKLDNSLTWIVYESPSAVNGTILQNVLSLFGFLFLVLGFFLITKNHSLGGWALLPTIGSSFIIAAGSQAWFNRKLLANRILVWFGLISFPLYLWHWPLLSFIRINENGDPAIKVKIVAVFIAIFLAWLTYKLVEKPIRFGRFRKATSVLVALMIVVGCVGYYIHVRKGLAVRFPKIIRELTRYKYDYANGFRYHTCFLEDEDYKKVGFADCGIARDKTKKTILLWGDSHAAHLYAGYKAVYGSTFNIIQRTASSCPPLIGRDHGERGGYGPYCKEMNNETFEIIRKEKPDKVVLTAAWVWYGNDWQYINKTIAKLKAIGISNIDLIGPVPHWDDLPKVLYQYFKKDQLHRVPPARMSFGLNYDKMQSDPLIEALALKEKVNYISIVKILCNTEGCLTRLGNTADTLISFDYGHFTAQGAAYVVSKFPKRL